MAKTYDAIVIGARCAGSPTAMLLARRGYQVLLVDRATFPSDTVSTHVVHPNGVAALKRWRILDLLMMTDCPPIHTYAFDFGPFAITGMPGKTAGHVAFCPRRTVLDNMLIEFASKSGAEVREGFTVDGLVFEDGRVVGIKGRAQSGEGVSERARVVIGADGRHSMVAAAVRPEQYNEKPQLLCGYYSYWSGLPMNGRFETYIRPMRGMAVAPTHDGLTLLIAGWPFAEFEANKKDLAGNYMSVIDMVPEFAERVRGAKREAPIAGTAVPNYFRKPYGPGWALVGDAGYNRDFITAQGISDAFRDAEAVSSALDAFFSGTRPFDEAMSAYQRTRDEAVLPMFEMTTQLATLEPPPERVQQLLGAVSRSRGAMDDFCRMNAGTLSPAVFYSPENVGAIMAATG